MENKSKAFSGACHCGSVSFEIVEGSGVIACHCNDCQKLHGNYNAMLAVKDDKISFLKEDTLTWYTSSDKAKRAFCSNCGSRLFKKANESDTTLVSMGLLEKDTGLKIIKNLYYDSRPDWYSLAGI